MQQQERPLPPCGLCGGEQFRQEGHHVQLETGFISTLCTFVYCGTCGHLSLFLMPDELEKRAKKRAKEAEQRG